MNNLIQMCKDKNCPKKNSCYRFKAVPSEFNQAYGYFKYKKECHFYWAEKHAPKKQIK